MSGLVRVDDDRAISGLQRAEEIWNDEQRGALARYLGVAPDNPALFPMLAVCAAWGLDPFAGQVWLIKQKGRDASGTERWRPAAGRDGYLAIANRQPDFKGLTGDVVRQMDRFEVEWMTTEAGMFPRITHSYAQGPRADGGGRDARGDIIGAWSILFRERRLPVYYFAPWTEHRRDPEKSAWSYRSAMILKAAQSMTLRFGYSITGLVPHDELAAGLPGSEDITEAPPERPWADDDLPWGEDEVGEQIRAAVQESWLRGSREWNRARLAMQLTGDRQALLEQIRESLPPEPEPEEVDGEPVPDEDYLGTA
jgi:RecT family